VIAFLEEGFALKRHASATVLGVLSAVGCLFVLYFSKDLVALDMMDFWVGSVALFMLAMIQSFLYGWMFGIKRGDEELHRGAHIRIPWVVQLILKFVVPVYLLVIFVGFCFQKLPSSDKPVFEIPASHAAELSNGRLAETLVARFAEQELSLPDQAVVVRETSGAADQGWRILDGNRNLQYRIVPGPDALAVKSHQAGYVESISKSPVAMLSMLFILVLFGFVIILVHIAGRRWQAEGRFESIPD